MLNFTKDLNLEELYKEFVHKKFELDSVFSEIIKEGFKVDVNNEKSKLIQLNKKERIYTIETFNLLKRYVDIVNEIGSVLPVSVEEKLDEKTVTEFYTKSMKFFLYSQLYYFSLLIYINHYPQEDQNKIFKNLFSEAFGFEKSGRSYMFAINPHYHEYFLLSDQGIKEMAKTAETDNNVKRFLAFGLEKTKQKELSDDYIIEKVKELISIPF